jgi:biopolymer transport protein ExbD
MNCVYNSLPDQGAKFKEVLNNAEQRLIDLNFLKSKNGTGYVEIYKNMQNMFSNDLKDLGVAKYMAEITSKLNNPETSQCMETLFAAEAFKDSKLSKMLVLIQSVGELKDGESLTNAILEILDPEDFTHDYYKMTTFTMLESMNQVNTSGWTQELPERLSEDELTDYERKNMLRIEVTEDEKVLMNGVVITTESLSEKVADYLREYETENVISLKGSLKASATLLLNVQSKVLEGFELIKNQVAIEKYSSDFVDLREILKKEISETYPMRIINIDTDE